MMAPERWTDRERVKEGEGEFFLLEGIARAPEDGPTAMIVQVALTRLRKLLQTRTKRDMHDVLGRGCVGERSERVRRGKWRVHMLKTHGTHVQKTQRINRKCYIKK